MLDSGRYTMGAPGDNIHAVSATATIPNRERIRGRRRSRPVTHPPHRARPGTGRAWINGHEVGGANQRFAHLGGSYD